MANILLTTMWANGDVLPFVRIASALKARGHQTTLITHCFYEDVAGREGIDFLAIDNRSEYEQFVEDGHLFNSPQGFLSIYQKYVLPKIELEYDLIRQHSGSKETIIITRSVPGFAARIAAEKLGLPVVSIFFGPSYVATMPLVEELVSTFLGDDINRIRAKMGLASITNWRSWLNCADRNIGLWPEWYAAVDKEWPFEITLTGFLWYEEPASESLPEEINGILDNDARPILITGGTSMLAGSKFFTASTEACRLVGRKGILVTRHDKLVPNPLPCEIRRFSYLPSLARLMPYVGAVVHHGGIITAVQALAAGVPQLALAAGGDRPDNASHFQRLRVAEVLPPPQWEAQDVATALDRLISSKHIQEQCKELSKRLNGADSASEICDMIDQLIIDKRKTEEASLALAASATTPIAGKNNQSQDRGKYYELVRKLSPEKRALFEMRLKRKAGKLVEPEPISRQSREEGSNVFPASFAQQRLWIINQLEPGSAAYNIPYAVRLSGRLDRDALVRSLNEIIARHEVLRTSFPSRDGEPRQQIHDSSDLQPDFLRLIESDEAERQEKLQEILRDEAGRGFDLSRGPLIRAKLIRLAEDRHVLIVNMHHIVSDGWSMEIMIGEFAQLYEAFTEGWESPLPELEIQYADYAVWQRGWLQGEVLDTQLQYWRRQLEGVEALELPTDRARPAVADYRGSSERVALSGELTEKLRQMSRQEGVTLFMSLLAGFQFLLARYSGQDDIAVGTPISGRNRRELEGLIGFFVNTLVMRVDLGGARTVSELLGRVRETALEAYAHQDLPFEKLVEELQPERSLSRTPLFQVMFAVYNAPFSVRQPGSLLAEVADVEVSTAKFDITLTLSDGGERLTGAVVYNSDLFDASTIKRMIEYYECLLEGIVSDITQPIWRLPRVTESEKKQLLLDWNDTGADYDPEICIHEMIEGQAGAMPDAIAVVFADQRISYGELDRRTNQAGNFLRRRGIGPETRVGLMLERSIELVVWMIGILKAGGAYVPIDAGFPAERIGFMLEDAEVKLLLMEPEILEWRPVNQVQVVPLDRGLYQIATESEEPLPVKATSRNLAYAIYTSGSTGYPKGVAVSHQEVSNFFTAMDGYLEPEPGAVWLAVTGIAFDISVLELLWTLSRGIQVVIQGDWRSAQPTSEEEKKRFERSQIVWQEEDNSIMAQITRRQVSHLQCTPSLARALCEWSDSVTQYSSLSKLLIGGEAFPVGLAANLKQLVRGEIRNMYGPTETTIWSTTHALNGEESSIPIGHPIANTRGYVLDGDLGLVPVGAAGELCLGGKGVVRGYLNRSELTAERFLPDEYGTEAGGRIYRTGDLVRYQADGKLEFLGRIDHQVKIRGMRIELGEIEVQQNTHPGISESVVTAGENEVGEKQLVSYFVGRAEGAPSANELRDYLKERLPEYLVPSLFVELEKLPLTANGKLDRRALPKPEQSGGCGEYVGPRSAVEEIVCGIWEEVLRVEKVGIYDNFFDLGGHSLLATQVVSRVRSALGVEVPLRVQFSNQTVAAFALEVEQRQRGVGKAAVEAIRRVARDGDLPLSYAQQRLWFIDQLEPGSAAYNIPSAVRLSGRLDVEALGRSLNDIIARHEVLRTCFPSRDGEPRQQIHQFSDLQPDFMDLIGSDEAEQQQHLQAVLGEEARRGFDLSSGPLIRAKLIRLAEDEHVLIVTMHHIVSDGWSIKVMVREFAQLYEAFTQGKESPLPELEIQYADYAEWQRQWMQGEVLESRLEYWRRQLDGVAMLELPTDRARPVVADYRGASESLLLSEELTEKLKQMSRREGVTLFMSLLAGFQVLLARYSGQQDIAVGTPIAGRNLKETEGLIGLFLNTLVMRVNVGGNPSVSELLARVREAALGAYAHQELPFEKLVDEIRPQRSLSYQPLFQVWFVLQNIPSERVDLPGLRVEKFPIEDSFTKFDLMLSLSEGQKELTGTLRYRTDLFDRKRVKRLLSHYEQILEGMVAYEKAHSAEHDVEQYQHSAIA